MSISAVIAEPRRGEPAVARGDAPGIMTTDDINIVDINEPRRGDSNLARILHLDRDHP